MTTGFTWFGTNVAYESSEGSLELTFWAAESNATAGVYGLYWNAGGTVLDGAFPVTLKNVAPTVVE